MIDAGAGVRADREVSEVVVRPPTVRPYVGPRNDETQDDGNQGCEAQNSLSTFWLS